MRGSSLALLLCACAGALVPTEASAQTWGGTNTEHEIAVYSLQSYGVYRSQYWKPSIPCSSSQDPYRDFYVSMMSGCNTSACGHTSSARFQDSAVTVNQMATTSETSTNRGWSGSDLVVFYGHNTQIRPQWAESIGLWNQGISFWDPYTLNDWRSWGTSSDPYQYHRVLVTDASLTNAFAVFYAYNPFTSILIGKDFPTSNTWYTENVWDQYTPDTRSNRLDSEVEWVIADGCNAVSVANPQGNAIALGVNAWKKSWTAMHMVLGHYAGTTTELLPNLNTFATNIKAGGTVKDSYFAVHSSPYLTVGQPAAIERAPWSCCTWNSNFGYWVCPTEGCGDDYFTLDTWEPNQMADLTGLFNSYYYATTWNVED